MVRFVDALWKILLPNIGTVAMCRWTVGTSSREEIPSSHWLRHKYKYAYMCYVKIHFLRRSTLLSWGTQSVDVMTLGARCPCRSVRFKVEESAIVDVVCDCGACKLVPPNQVESWNSWIDLRRGKPRKRDFFTEGSEIVWWRQVDAFLHSSYGRRRASSTVVLWLLFLNFVSCCPAGHDPGFRVDCRQDWFWRAFGSNPVPAKMNLSYGSLLRESPRRNGARSRKGYLGRKWPSYLMSLIILRRIRKRMIINLMIQNELISAIKSI